VFGLPCHHDLQYLHTTGSKLGLRHFEDDHWRYERSDGHSISFPRRAHQHMQDPLPVQGRGRPRNDITSTRRDPSAFELPVLPTASLIPPTRLPTLAEILQDTETARLVSPPLRSPTDSEVGSQDSQATKSEHTPEPELECEPEPEPETIRLTLEEFLIEVDRRKQDKSQSTRGYRDPFEFATHLERTGQQNYSYKLIHAFEKALATAGMFSHFTPTMAYNFYFNREAYEIEREAQRADEEAQQSEEAPRPSKRPAAQLASNAWAGLRPKKRARRE
jgi:hypothetical protein